MKIFSHTRRKYVRHVRQTGKYFQINNLHCRMLLINIRHTSGKDFTAARGGDMGDAAAKLDQQQEPTTIAWVDVRLRGWAEWCETGGGVVGLGYGSNPIGSAVENGGQIIRSTGPAAQPDSYDPCYEVDQAVTRLPGELRDVVVEHYRHADAPEAKRVRRCGCSRRTYFRRLARAHQSIAFLLPTPKRLRSGTEARDRMRERFSKKGRV